MVEFRCTFNNHLDASWFTYNFVPTTAITNEVGQEKESSAVFSTGPTTRLGVYWGQSKQKPIAQGPMSETSLFERNRKKRRINCSKYWSLDNCETSPVNCQSGTCTPHSSWVDYKCAMLTRSHSPSTPFPFLLRRCHSDMSVLIAKTLVIWASLTLTLTLTL